jgi:hypothetical protein
MTLIPPSKPAWWNLMRLGFLTGLSVSSALAQVSAVRSGSIEVGPFVGASYGVDHFRVMAGGNVTYALKNKYVLPYFEYSYFPGIPRTFSGTTMSGSTTTTVTGSYKVALNDVHGGVHIRLPIFKESPIVPYLVFGMGVLAYPNTTETITNTNMTPTTGTSMSTSTLSRDGASDFTINAGGGLRYYLGGTGKYGFRVEAKVYKPISGLFSNDTIGKVEAGFFFQLR